MITISGIKPTLLLVQRFLMATTAAIFSIGLFGQPVYAAEPIKVGITVSLSGAYSAPGQEMLQGVQMWVDDINARGALLGHRVELVFYDDQSNANTSASLYEQLISEDNVDLLLGPYSSDITMAASSVAEQHNFPMLATGAADNDIWTRGYKNIFGIDGPAKDRMDLLITSAENANLQRIALVYEGKGFPREVASGVREQAPEHGMEIVFDEEYSQATTDFAALIKRAKESNPDILIGATYLKDSIVLVQEAKKSDFSPKALVFTVGPALVEFGNQLGDDADGIMGIVSWTDSVHLPMARDFAYRYKMKYGNTPGVHAGYGYGAGQTIEAATRLAGSVSRDAIRKQLSEMEFHSMFGRYRVDKTGKQLGKSVYIMQWQDGRRRLVSPKNLAEKPIRYPFTPWAER